jgi:hypothetical protein
MVHVLHVTSITCVPVCIDRTSSLLLSASRDCTARLWDARCKMPLLHVFQVLCPVSLRPPPPPLPFSASLPQAHCLFASLPLWAKEWCNSCTVAPLLQGCNSDHSSMDARTGAFKHGDVGALFARRILCLDGKRRLLCQGEKSRV